MQSAGFAQQRFPERPSQPGLVAGRGPATAQKVPVHLERQQRQRTSTASPLVRSVRSLARRGSTIAADFINHDPFSPPDPQTSLDQARWFWHTDRSTLLEARKSESE